MRLTEKGERACAHPGCRIAVTDDDHCAGCGFYICEKHSPESPWGKHDVVEHWTAEDEDYE